MRIGSTHLAIELYVILDEDLLGPSRLERALEGAMLGGADAIQLRAKHLSRRAYYETASDLLSMTRHHGIPMFINDYLDVAIALGADGIHLGQNDLPCIAAKRIAPPGMLVGISTHSVAEAQKAASDGADYVAIGSVFPTSTKQNPEAIIGTAMVSEVSSVVGDKPLIAIGGIGAANVGDVIRAGADAVAVASAVVAADDPRAAARELKEEIRRASAGSA